MVMEAAAQNTAVAPVDELGEHSTDLAVVLRDRPDLQERYSTLQGLGQVIGAQIDEFNAARQALLDEIGTDPSFEGAKRIFAMSNVPTLDNYR